MKIGKKFFTPSLPLHRGKSFDYEYIDNAKELVKQNAKNLLMTIPGERVMNPDFGVGILSYLFEEVGVVKKELRNRIREQFEKYLPYVTINGIDIVETGENSLSVSLVYEIPDLGQEDNLVIDGRSGVSSGGPKFII